MESRSDMFRRMVEMNNKQQPQMKQVLGQLGLKEENVLACWLVGSRLWGTARSESDWDFVFVLKDVGGERFFFLFFYSFFSFFFFSFFFFSFLFFSFLIFLI